MEYVYLRSSCKTCYTSIHQTCQIFKRDFQLVGVTAMFIACKYEEIYFPELADFLGMTENAYQREEMRAMEVRILKALDYTLGTPAVVHFLRRYSRIAEVRKTEIAAPQSLVLPLCIQVTSKVHVMARFLSELCAVDYQMLEFVPSQQAAACLTLAIKLLGDSSKRKWVSQLRTGANV